MTTALTRILGRLERLGRLVEDTALVVGLGAMIVLGAGQILLRNGFGIGFIWADELLRILVLWVAMLGAIAASRDDNHISIDILSRFLPGTPKRIASLVVSLFTAVVCGVMAWYSTRFVLDSREFGDTILNGQPAWVAQAIIPVALALICYRYTVLALKRIVELVRGAPSP